MSQEIPAVFREVQKVINSLPDNGFFEEGENISPVGTLTIEQQRVLKSRPHHLIDNLYNNFIGISTIAGALSLSSGLAKFSYENITFE